MSGFSCFGCGDSNPCGLRMEFWEEGDELICFWDPQDHFQGYSNILHGGIQATLIDEIASWVVFWKNNTAGVTSRLNITYKNPVYTNQGQIRLQARLLQARKRIATIAVELFNARDELCTTGEAVYYLFSRAEAEEKFGFKGKEDFQA